MRNEKGSLTVEASIALVVFIFFIMFFLGFNSVYRAQGMVSHAVLQTSQSLAISSFLRETVSSEKTVSNAQNLLKPYLRSSLVLTMDFRALGPAE